MPLDKDQVKIGMRVQNHNGLAGTVRFMGKFEKKDKPPRNDTGTYLGVEYDEPLPDSPDRCDGTWNGVRHFTCAPGAGEFLKPKDFSPEMNPRAVADLRAKYGERIAGVSDNQLIKFCIARRYDMPKVCLMMEKHFEWVASFKPTPDEFFPAGMAEDYPCGYAGHDREGNLLYFERPGNAGKCSPADFVRRYGIETIARWHVASMESGKRLLQETGFKSKRVTCIVDLTNLGDTGRPMIQFGKTIAAIDQDNYPEHLARLFIINAPSFFTTIWKVVRLFVDDRTKGKIFILDSKEQRETLTRYIDPAFLPSFAGGTSEAWLSRGGRIGSEDPSKVVEGVTVIAAATEQEIEEAAAAAAAAPEEPAAAPEPTESPSAAKDE